MIWSFRKAERGNVACFQVDCSDGDLECGWSVTAIGTLSLLSDPIEVRSADQLRLPCWSASATNLVRLRPAMLTGRSRCRFAAVDE